MTSRPESSHAQEAGAFRVVHEQECLELLATTTVGRVAFVNEDGTQLVPLNFAYIDGEIYFRTAEDSILAGLAGNDDVAFGIDHHAELYREGWNVTVRGAVSLVSDPALRDQVLTWSRLDPWAGGTRGVVLHLARRTVEGRRVHRPR